MKGSLQRTYLLPVLLLLVLFSPLGIDIYLPSMPDMAGYFATTAAKVQYTLSLFLLSMGLGQLVAGPLVDRFGRRPLVMLGISWYSLCALAAVWATTIEWLMLVRLAQGIAASTTSVVAFAVVRDRFPPSEGAKILSYLNGALNISPALAPLLGGMLAAQWGWVSNFWFLAGFGLVVLAVTWKALPETKPELTAPSNTLNHYREIISNRAFRYYSGCCFAAMAVIICFVSFAPIILREQLGLSETGFALLFAMNALANMLASFIAPWVLERIGRYRCVQLGLAMMITGGALMLLGYLLFGVTVAGMMGPVIVGTSGFAMLMGAASSLALAPFPHCAGTAAALLGCIQMMLAALASMVVMQSPWPPLLTLAGVMILLGLVPMVIARFKGGSEDAVTELKPVN